MYFCDNSTKTHHADFIMETPNKPKRRIFYKTTIQKYQCQKAQIKRNCSKGEERHENERKCITLPVLNSRPGETENSYKGYGGS